MQAQVALLARLKARREEIEQALLVRVHAVADPTEVGDGNYLRGLRDAVSAALDVAFDALERPQDPDPVVPAPLVSQARLAARHGVGLDTVARRFNAGQALLADFAIAEASRDRATSADALRGLLAALSAAFDHLLAAVGEEYAKELENSRAPSRDSHRVRLCERLLAGEAVEPGALSYDLGGWHIGLVASGLDRQTLSDLARAADRRLLVVEPQPNMLWAWLGGGRRIETAMIASVAARRLGEASIGLGEPAAGLAGWRLTHQQAKRVLPFARGESAIARYAEQGLLASICQDQVLAESLQQIYLDPLRDGDDEDLWQTLRAYFAAGCNISSAASALAVHRQTVSGRLRSVEERLERPLRQCTAELIVALALQGPFPAPEHAT